MRISLIVCTFMRPEALQKLLQSVKTQTVYPYEILVIDGSLNNETAIMLTENEFKNLRYFLVTEEQRGLTKQRNFGIEKSSPESEIIAFLDDDTELHSDYFEELAKTFNSNIEITGVGGIAINENNWKVIEQGKKYNRYRHFKFDGYVIHEGQRNVLRNYLGLDSKLPPGKMPEYSHGKTCGFPLNDKTYEVDLLIGMSFAFRRIVMDSLRFSTYFEGYGLYEDADFSLRALQFGRNVINTKVKLKHYHNPSGRPNQYKYGRMVVRNGWYVWRVRNPHPSLKAWLMWNLITVLLTIIRFSNTFTTVTRREALSESLGRMVGWFSLILYKPKILK